MQCLKPVSSESRGSAALDLPNYIFHLTLTSLGQIRQNSACMGLSGHTTPRI